MNHDNYKTNNQFHFTSPECPYLSLLSYISELYTYSMYNLCISKNTHNFVYNH